MPLFDHFDFLAPIYDKLIRPPEPGRLVELADLPVKGILPFSANFFDRIIMVDTLHHVYDQLLTARELWRVLSPGGRIVVEEPDIRAIPVKIVAILERFALMRSRFLSPEKILDLFFCPNADRSIEKEDYTSWIIVQKT